MAPHAISAAVLHALYPPSIPLSILHLTTQEMAAYTCILTCHPSTGASRDRYKKRTSAQINALPSTLQSPAHLAIISEAFITSALQKIGVSADVVPRAAKLCNLHARLNGQLIASARFHMLEVLDMRLPQLLPRVDARDLSAQSEREIRAGERANDDLVWSYGCAACKLSKVGSNADVLVLLYALTTMRERRYATTPGARGERKRETKVREWVDAWIHAYSACGAGVDADQLRRRGDVLRMELSKSASPIESSAMAPSPSRDHDRSAATPSTSSARPPTSTTAPTQAPSASPLPSRHPSQRNPSYRVATASALLGAVASFPPASPPHSDIPSPSPVRSDAADPHLLPAPLRVRRPASPTLPAPHVPDKSARRGLGVDVPLVLAPSLLALRNARV